MDFKNFRLQIVIRLFLAVLGLFGLIYYSYIELNYIRVFFIAVYIVIVVVELFHYINRTNRDTTNFLQAILNNDFTIKYTSEHKGRSFKQLYETFNEVNEKFLAVTQKEASEYQYIATLIEQLDVGVLSYDERGRIQLVNAPLKRLLGKHELINLQSIERVSKELYDCLTSLSSGGSELLKVTINNKLYQLSINSSEFLLRQRHYKLVSIQDIRGELDENEMAAWQKLIRVLTHEIMNSVAPITSLSSTLHLMVTGSQKSDKELDKQQLQSLRDGLDAIENRSQGLMNFTQAYRSLTRIPLPNIQSVDGQSYFQRINSLFSPTLRGTQIQFKLQLPAQDFELQIDPDLIQQVIINLLKNAKEAVNTVSGQVALHVEIDSGRDPSTLARQQQVRIEVEDNGPGIPDEVLEKIFIPFYTTKPTGSGVGLSFAKQVVNLHKGELGVESNATKSYTRFTITL